MILIRYSLRRYDNLPRLKALVESFVTTVYFFILWFPMVLFICGKILFCKKDMKWGKTAHGLVKEEKQRIIDEINKKLQIQNRKLLTLVSLILLLSSLTKILVFGSR